MTTDTTGPQGSGLQESGPMITGKDLISWGLRPGRLFKEALELARGLAAGGADPDAIRESVRRLVDSRRPVHQALRAVDELDFHRNIEAESEHDAANIADVVAHMRELMRVPVVTAGAVMPDACPTGLVPGTIPVGGVVASRGIHPGMHSADICCSVAISVLPSHVDPARVLDAGMARSTFGPFARKESDPLPIPAEVLAGFDANPLLRTIKDAGIRFFGTQGDGNHFFFVGRLASSGEVAMVTHHGSRKPGALLYKHGQTLAQRHTQEASPATPAHNAWLDPASEDGRAYWDALLVIRAWTRASHFAIHDAVCAELGQTAPAYGEGRRFWNEHNFVFLRDGLYYHGKGATPAYPGFATDDTGLTLIPLNMASPVLITRGRDAAHGLGFAPHGAGRNHGRRRFLRDIVGDRDHATVLAEQTRGIDARFVGSPDLSELPAAYKSADQVRRQIERYGLAEVVDLVEPYGSIMAGEIEMPWKLKAKAKEAGRKG